MLYRLRQGKLFCAGFSGRRRRWVALARRIDEQFAFASHGLHRRSRPGHNYIGHNYIAHNYIGHDYTGHNYNRSRRTAFRDTLAQAPTHRGHPRLATYARARS